MQKSSTLFMISTTQKAGKVSLRFSIYLFTIFVFLFTSSVNAQERNVSKSNSIQTINSNIPNAPQVEEGDIKITDGTNTLIRITDEGTFGAIEINPGVPSTTTDKLYNDNGTLKFGTTSLGGVPTYSVGDLAQGGFVIEVSPNGEHGLVAALQDQSTNEYWSLASDLLSDEANHEVSGKNYKDWRLPTKRELNLMYNQRASIGGFSNDWYWSSIEIVNDANKANLQNFDSGFEGTSQKSSQYFVRAVRIF